MIGSIFQTAVRSGGIDEAINRTVQPLTDAVSGTVGIGNIAGVAITVSIGGPGAIFWLVMAGLVGMTTKFVECTLGVKYRQVSADGTVSGGPIYYLRAGFERRGWLKLGRFPSRRCCSPSRPCWPGPITGPRAGPICSERLAACR